MGKKRRLKSAKRKFSAKHANHPRMQLINNSTDVEPEVIEVAASTPLITHEESVEAALSTVLQATPEVEVPPPIVKPKRTRKTKKRQTKSRSV
jgi:hypothetical protein|tara:strand:- start:112 stop:390 length:279 start_codon:yes stop_codon:yes gene_type:complete